MLKRLFLISYILLCLCPPAMGAELLPAGASFEVGFTPSRNAEAIILKAIGQARKSIQVAAYSFTSKPVSLALLDAHKQGVSVMIIADAKSNTSKYSAITFLANHGVPVRVNANYAIFHHKFIIFDGLHVETGSFNFSSAAAEKNAENVLMLWNVPQLAGQYGQEWQRLWLEGLEVKTRH